MFNFVDLCSGVGIAWSTITRTRVNDATAVTFSLFFAVGWALCGRPQPEHESMMPLLSLSRCSLQWGGHCVVDHNPNTSQ